MKLTAVTAALILVYGATASPIGHPARSLTTKDLEASANRCPPCLKKPCNWKCDDTISDHPYENATLPPINNPESATQAKRLYDSTCLEPPCDMECNDILDSHPQRSVPPKIPETPIGFDAQNATTSSVDSSELAGVTKRLCICHIPPCGVGFCKDIIEPEQPVNRTGLEIYEEYRGTITHPDQEIPRPIISDRLRITPPSDEDLPPATTSCTRPTITKNGKQEKSEMGECGGPGEHDHEEHDYKDEDENDHDHDYNERLTVLDWCTTPECAAARKAAKEAAAQAAPFDNDEHHEDEEAKIPCYFGVCPLNTAAEAKAKDASAGMQKRHRLAWNTPEGKRAWLERMAEKAELDEQWHAEQDKHGDMEARDDAVADGAKQWQGARSFSFPDDADGKFWCTSLDCEAAKKKAGGVRKRQGTPWRSPGAYERFRKNMEENAPEHERHLEERPEKADGELAP